MSSPPSASKDSGNTKQDEEGFLALIRIYDRVMRWRATPFSVPQDRDDPLLPSTAVPEERAYPDPEAHSIDQELVFQALDLSDPEVKATQEMTERVQKAQERLRHNLAIQPEFEPYTTIPMAFRGARMVRQVQDITVLEPVSSTTQTRTLNKDTGRFDPTVRIHGQIRNLRWKSERLLAGRVVWPAEPILVRLKTREMLSRLLASLDAPSFPLTPIQWGAKEGDAGIQLVSGTTVPHHGAMVELIHVFPLRLFHEARGRLMLTPERLEQLRNLHPWKASDGSLDLLQEALDPPGGSSPVI